MAELGRQAPVETLLADRGYTYLQADKWALPIHRMGIEQVFDLHVTQRGTHPGPITGTLFLDGGLFTSVLPQRHHDLPAFSLGMTAAENAALCDRYDERAAYAFTTHG